jgi:endo-1,4-beta-xylanase
MAPILFSQGMNRRAFLKTGASATALLLGSRSWAAETERTGSTNVDILAEAKASIEKHRQGDGMVVVRNLKGEPIAGARVVVEQLRHDFLFGCNFFMFGRCGNPDHEEQYRQRFAALLNYCTLAFYWGSYEPERGKPNYDYTDKVVEWTQAHGITCKGHPLVWDHPASSPRWLPEDQKEIEQLSNARVQDLVSRFQGRIHIWDVVNEATHLPQKANQTRMAMWGAAIGPERYVGTPLKLARAANPHATLLVNDYRTDVQYYQILQKLRQDGRFLFDTIGIQSHMHAGVWPLRKVWDICDTYARLGLPIHFTETTIVSGPRKGRGEEWSATTPEGEVRQAEETERFYTTLFAHPAVQAITWWDFADRGAWQGAPAGWLRNDFSPKPVYERLMALIKGAWWTRLEGRTDAHGKFNARAFYGRHRLTVEAPAGQKTSREIHWERGRPTEIEFKL